MQKAEFHTGSFTALCSFSVICTVQKKTKFKTEKDNNLIDKW